jgi:hypothetical protein
MVFSIDGTDIRSFIAEDGVKWQRNDIDGENAGRSKSGTMIRDRIGIKMRCDITCRPLTLQEARLLQSLIEPEFVSVQYTDLLYGDVTKVMYSNNGDATISAAFGDSDALIRNVTFPLIEQ